MKTALRTLDVRTRLQWRRWLEGHHDSVSEIWLVFHKQHTRVSSLTYDESVEEALCFGWIDSLVRRLDDERYMRKFTARKPDSRWSTANRRRYEALQERGLLAAAGLARAPTSSSGDAPRPRAVPKYIVDALKSNSTAWRTFQTLAPSYRRQFIGWIDSAKHDATRQKRIQEAIRLLAAGRKLGLK